MKPEAPEHTVLLVDDDPALLRALGREFRDLGFAVCTAAGVQDAVTLVNEQEVDLAVVDLILHDNWGIEVVEALRNARPTLPIILCTGFARMQWVGDVARAAAVRCVDKPTNARTILAMLDAKLA